ncbi:MAG: hypothetical protein E6G65_04965 [Actinobacteria bacterium]|nr:MAG: hypothetical protein E6G65_04965 [Actinomycetota bacterium]
MTGWTGRIGPVIMDDVSEVVRIPLGGGGEEPTEQRASPPPADWFTLAARAAVGLVSLGAEASIQIIRIASGTPERDLGPLTSDSVALLAGAALGLAIEAVRTAAALAELGWRAAGPPASFIIGTVAEAPRRAGADLLDRWNQSWREERPEVQAVANAVAVEATRRAIDLVLDQLDLTQLVLDHVDIERIVASVDLNEVVEQLDVDAVADRLDIERVIARLDLAKLSLEVIERIDLPEIIRTSTGTVASESVRVVRMQTFGADRAISGLVNRMLGRSTTGGSADRGDLDATGD